MGEKRLGKENNLSSRMLLENSTLNPANPVVIIWDWQYGSEIKWEFDRQERQETSDFSFYIFKV